MATTPRTVLRARILSTLLANQGRVLTRKQVLDRMRAAHEALWTEEDVASSTGRRSEAKWEHNASFERANMVREGLLEEGGDGHWVLTARGIKHATEQDRQLPLIDDLDVDNRGYAQLRAGQLLLDVTGSSEATPDPIEDPDVARVELEQIEDVPFEAIAAAVPLEEAATFEYHLPPRDLAVAIKKEAALVERFTAHLVSSGEHVGRFRIPLPGGGTRHLLTDIASVTANCLYEAKASADRDSVRMALGPLLDYSRFIEPAPRLAVLLPAEPAADLLDLLDRHSVECVFEAGEGVFVRRPEL